MVKTCLEVMDYHKSIFKLKMVSPPQSDSNYKFQPEVEEREAITGHWEDITYAMIERAPEGIYNTGDRMFYYSGVMAVRDKILIEELDGSLSKWEVAGTERTLPYWSKVGVVRNAYHLKRVQTVEVTDSLTPPEPVIVGAPVVATVVIPKLDPAPTVPAPPVQPAPQPTTPPVEPAWTPSWVKKKG
jgi:hypothetical protein